MHYSCKISASVLQFLESRGEDISPLLEATFLPEEFLKDSSFWMLSQEMEAFLKLAVDLFQKSNEISLITQIGHRSPELRSWGVLDSVIRMMPNSKDILAQPSRFLGYFISPEPPVENLSRTNDGTRLVFDLPISSEQYPLVCEYLSSALESLPVFMGQPMAHCYWEGIHVKVSFEQPQDSLFQDTDPGHQLSPDLLQSIVHSLEKHQRELEQKNKELQKKNDQLAKAQKEMETKVSFPLFENAAPITAIKSISESEKYVLRQNLSKLSDYLVRAQQLITILVGQERTSPQVKEAMRRMDWEHIQKNYPSLIHECKDMLLDRSQYDERHQNHSASMAPIADQKMSDTYSSPPHTML